MTKRLTTKSMTLPELLRSRSMFVLPPSQRVYGWGEAQVDGLFSDLGLKAATAPIQRQDMSPWLFLGTVYLADQASGCTAIADGQQRVVTGTMLYAAARDLETDPDLKAQLHECVGARDGGDETSPYRLRLRDIDQAFFRRWVQEPGATLKPYAPEDEASEDIGSGALPLSDSQTNILNNRNLIVEQLRALQTSGRQRLFDFLARSSELVVITSKELADASYAYASTHKRGLKQATSDKLKAEILRDAPPGLRADLANHWDEGEAKLGKDALEDLLELMVLNEAGPIVNSDLQTDVLKVFNLPDMAEHFINQKLVPATLAYRQIIGKREHFVRFLNAGLRERRRVKRIKGLLETLMRVTHIEWRAPALTMLLEVKTDLHRLERLLARLERMAAINMIAGHEPQTVHQRYFAITKALRANDDGALERAFAIDATLRTKARDQIQSANFGIKSRYRMPVLLKLNDLLSGDVVPVNPAAVSCEHVLPQNVGKDNPAWFSVFRSPNGQRYIGHNYRHRLGNMTILSHADNRAVGARPFAEKRPIFQNSAYVISQQAGLLTEWTIATVEARSAMLAQTLFEHWEI